MTKKPYLFDTYSFDKAPVVVEAEQESPEDLPVVFSESELQQKVEEAFKSGKEEGFRESEEGFSRQIHDVARGIGLQLEELLSQEAGRGQRFNEDVLKLVSKIIHTGFPQLNETQAIVEIQQAVSNALQDHAGKSVVIIETHPENIEALENYVFSRFADKKDNIQLEGKPDMGKGQVSMRWSHGGAVIDLEGFQKKTEKLFTEALAGFRQNPQDIKGDQE